MKNHLQEKLANVLMVCFSGIEHPRNGYQLRCQLMFNFYKRISKNIIALECVNEKQNEHNMREDTAYIKKIKTLHYYPKSLNTLLEKILSLDPIMALWFEFELFYKLVKCKVYFQKASHILVEGGLMFPSLIVGKILKKKIIFDTHAINVDIANKFKKKNFFTFIIRKTLWWPLEFLLLKFSDEIIVVSQRDLEYIQKKFHVKVKKISIIENQSNVKIRNKHHLVARNLRKELNLTGRIVISFIGDLRAVHNRKAAVFIVEELAREFRSENRTTFLIIGNNSVEIDSKTNNVIFTGFVEILEPYLVITDIFIAPLTVGGGVKTKMLDYISTNKPVITTSCGQEGIKLKYSKLIVTDIDNFVNSIRAEVNKLKNNR